MRAPPDRARTGRLLTWFWMVLVTGIAVAWVAAPELFDAEVLAARLDALGGWAWFGFVAISLVRGVFLVPSTPIILAGAAIFPEEQVAVFLISMAGICVAAGLLYRFPGFAGYDTRLAARYP